VATCWPGLVTDEMVSQAVQNGDGARAPAGSLGEMIAFAGNGLGFGQMPRFFESPVILAQIALSDPVMAMARVGPMVSPVAV
jgi:hypothetical protein